MKALANCLFAAACLLGGCDDKPATAPTPSAAAASTTALAPSASAAPPATPTIKGEEVTYEAGGTKLKGYLAYDPAQKGKRPGVLVVHEWWGHNKYVRKRAIMLARLGYTALALDMYGEGKNTDHPEDAKKFMNEVFESADAAKARFLAAKKLLEEHETTNPDQTAAIGYCFGGAVVLNMARAGVDLDAVASFHGNLATETPAKSGDVKAKILVLHGNADPFVPAEQVDAFKKEMEAAGADMKFIGYDGAKHAFTNTDATEMGKKNDLPLAYDDKADKASWDELKRFLAETFK